MSTASSARSLLLLSNGIDRLRAAGDLFLGPLNSKVVYCDVDEFTRWSLKGLRHELVQQSYIISVSTNDPTAELMFSMCIVEHFASVHDGLDAGHEFLGVLIGFRCDVLQFG